LLSHHKPYSAAASPTPTSPLLQAPSSSHGHLVLHHSAKWPARYAACLLPPHLHRVKRLPQMLLGHRGRAVPSPIKASSDVPHFGVLIPSPLSSTSGTHQFCCRIPPSRLMSWTTSLCPLDRPPNTLKAFKEFPKVFSNTGAWFRRLSRSKSASSSGTSNAPSQGM
jgi:hypothetical protein